MKGLFNFVWLCVVATTKKYLVSIIYTETARGTDRAEFRADRTDREERREMDSQSQPMMYPHKQARGHQRIRPHTGGMCSTPNAREATREAKRCTVCLETEEESRKSLRRYCNVCYFSAHQGCWDRYFMMTWRDLGEYPRCHLCRATFQLIEVGRYGQAMQKVDLNIATAPTH
jgi:hypothetical protein